MKIVKQLAILLLVSAAGEILAMLLPFNAPGSVLGMLLLLGLLFLGVVKQPQIAQSGNFLIGILPFLLLPAGVGLMEYMSQISADIWKIVLICILSTVVVYAVTALSIQAGIRLQRRIEDRRRT